MNTLPLDAQLQEQRLLAALAAAGTGVWCWDLRGDRFTWTPECFRIFGVEDRGEALGLGTYWNLIHPEDIPGIQERIEVAVRTRQPLSCEYRVQRPDGQVRWVVSEGRAEYDAAGRPVSLSGTLRDITEQKHVELRGRESQERLSLTVEASGMGLWTWDLATGQLTWTSQCYAILGAREGEFDLRADTFFDRLVHPADRDRVRHAVQRAIHANEPYVCEFRIVRPGGDIAWVVNRGRARYDGTGAPVALLGTIADVSGLKQAEVALEAALAASRTGTFRWDIRDNSLQWDHQLHRLFGMPPDQTVQSLEAFMACVHPDDRAQVVEACERCRLYGDGFEEEFRVVWPDGSVRWLYDRGVTYRDHLGRPAWMTGACVDITERKLTELELQLTQQRFRVALEAASDIVWTNDPQGRMTGEQPSWAAFTGQSSEAYQGYGWATAVHPDDAARSIAAWQSSVDRGVKYISEDRVRRHDGVYRTFAIRALPVKDEAGRILEWVGVHTDVTEVREAQRTIERQNVELRSADASKDIFLATLSHELRNPMAPIRAAAELLANPALPPDRIEWARGVIQRQVAHVSHLLDDLLDISRITQGKIALRRSLLALDQVVASAVEAAMPLADQRRHRLTVDLPQPAPRVLGDAGRLAQVLGNLLTNACKYTDPGGRIELRARSRDGWVAIEVGDDGVGMPPEVVPTLFQMFRQVGDPGRSDGGLGVGLALVRGLVELHGGRVEAASAGLGQGSTFTVHLPLADTPVPQVPAPEAEPDAARRARRVLVVDDNLDAGETLGEVLRMVGHEVAVAGGGEQGLRLAREFAPDLAFIDLGMPGLDGYTVARTLRADAATAGILLVALTGWGQPEDRERTREAGFSVHLTKPVDLEVVERLVQQLAG